MKKLLIAVLAISIAAPVAAQVRVKGYVRSDGTYVAPHVRSAPDNSVLNNYSTVPNVNPYTGRPGTVNPYAPSTFYAPPKPKPAPCYYNCRN